MSGYKKFFGTLIPVIAMVVACHAQNQAWAGFGVEANFFAGKIYKHTPKFTLPLPAFPHAIDVNLLQKTWGKRQWQQSRHYPVIGLGITYTDYGIDSVYGKAIGVYPNLQVPIISGKSLEWTLRFGLGASYISRHFERAPAWDTVNVAISSHFNNFTILVTDLRYHVNEHLDIQLGGNFTHISNAVVKKPNLGINMFGGHIGLRYFPVTSKPQTVDREIQPLRKRWLIQARAGLSLREDGYTDGPMYPAYLATLYVSRRWKNYNKMYAGIDYAYFKRTEAFLKNNEIYVGHEAAHSYSTALLVGNEFLFGRIGVLLQAGYYIKAEELKAGPFYEKIGGTVYLIQQEQGILKELCLCAILKAYKVDAELVEFGFGVGF